MPYKYEYTDKLYNQGDYVILQKIHLEEKQSGRLEVTLTTQLNDKDIYSVNTEFKPEDAGMIFERAVDQVMAFWEEGANGAARGLCEKVMFYAFLKQAKPEAELVETLLKCVLVDYYSPSQVLISESKMRELNPFRDNLREQFMNLRHALHTYESERLFGPDVPTTDRYENALHRVEGAIANIECFLTVEVWDDEGIAPEAGNEKRSADEMALHGEEEKEEEDKFYDYTDPGEPMFEYMEDELEEEFEGEFGDNTEDEKWVVGSGIDNPEEEIKEDPPEWEVPQLEAWKKEQITHETGEQTPLMRLTTELEGQFLTLREHLTDAWYKTAGTIRYNQNLRDPDKREMLKNIKDIVSKIENTAQEFYHALKEEGSYEHQKRFEQLMFDGWRNENGEQVKGLMGVVQEMYNMVNTGTLKTYIEAARPRSGTIDLPE